MYATATAIDLDQDRESGPPIVIVGAGPVGMRVQRLLHERRPDLPIVVYGDEPWEPYDRVRLSSLLAGEVRSEVLRIRDAGVADHVTTRLSCRVVAIDRDSKVVVDGRGHRQPYDKLVLATGSRPFIPAVPGIDLPGVYTFRDLSDAAGLIARRARSRRVAVLGGGLLGIEAARAMQRFGTSVQLIEHNTHLMFRQLDSEAGGILRTELEAQGVEVVLQEAVRMVAGTSRVEGLVFASGREVECDTLIVATGIRPNVDLAAAAGLSFGRGIQVDSGMATSDPEIFAVGECCEVGGRVYGLVAPGFEQADVAVQRLVGESSAYEHTVLATSLKVSGLTVFSLGDPDPDRGFATSHVFRAEGVYRRINLERGRISGIVGIGDWPEVVRLRELAKRGKRFAPWTWHRFDREGSVWADDVDTGPRTWPEAAVVCSCATVTKGEILRSIDGGCATVEALGECTQAGRTCGSCRPSLAELLGGDVAREPTGGYRALVAASSIALVLSVVALVAPTVPYLETVQATWQYDATWIDSYLKQVSGFGLLGLAAAGLVLTVRKRTKVSLGPFAGWRLAHVWIGVAAFFLLWAHTGFRLGSHLNAQLMTVFVAVLLSGAILGIAIGAEHRLPARWASRLREGGFWVHVLLLMPLPALVGLHVLKTYYF